MLTIGTLAFLSPWVLAGLLALPIIYWLLRFTPPRPRVQTFPPLRLLLDLARTEETPDRSPWWLTLLRMVIAALVIVAFARPVLNPTLYGESGSGPLVVVIDNGWAAADDWDRRSTVAFGLVESAGRDGRQVVIAASSTPGELALESAELALRRVESLAPAPHAPDRPALLQALEPVLSGETSAQFAWISDRLAYGDDIDFAAGLSGLASETTLTIYSAPAEAGPLWVPPVTLAEGDLQATIRRADGAARVAGEAVAYALNGRLIDRQPYILEGGETETTAIFKLPNDLRNQVARIEVLGHRSAGSVTLLDERWQRRIVAMVSGGSVELAQPLLAPLYYVERALGPFTELRRPSFGEAEPMIDELIADGLSMIILADVGTLLERERDALRDWVEAGGTLLRFAGPRLAGGSDNLLPVALRRGGRSLGGALSWAEPQRLSPIDPESPFAGLDISDDVTVSRQVLAEPEIGLAGKTWARLTDGTPLVTADRLGKGRIVLFHVTANAEWSNLPLSGLFVDMLVRILRLSQTAPGGEAAQTIGAEFLNPSLVLSGQGRLIAPTATAQPIARDQLDTIRPELIHPPGFYGPASARFALNTVAAEDTIGLMPEAGGATRIEIGGKSEVALLPWLLICGLVLLLLDAIAVLAMAGVLPGRRSVPQRAASLGALIALTSLLVTGLATGSQAQDGDVDDTFALQASLDTRLAFVLTGDAAVDEISEAGLSGLSAALRNRTALEPGTPMGVNIERDELVFFPILYWPVLPDAQSPSDAAVAKIDAYMKFGGTILFDTADEVNALPGSSGARRSPNLDALQRLLSRLDIPALQPVPASHVLTKAFYLLQAFPGRFEGGPLWVQAILGTDQAGQPVNQGNGDGVSSIIIGSNDYAGAWATRDDGSHLLPTTSGHPRQREMAFRVGVNIVMYALTGNYKADQVHIPALLERLGQ